MFRSLLPAFLLLFYHASSAQVTDPRRELLDIEHYHLSITLNDNNDSIVGEAVLTVKFLRARQGFDLDLISAKPDGKGMTVSSVTEGEAKIHFTQTEGKLHIDAGGAAGDTHWFTIRYAGIPADGLIIAKNKYGHRTFFADNWPDRAHHWFPCVDHPSDKASVEFIVTAPDHYQVVSNGVKMEETNLPDHMRLTHWQETVALPTKIMVIGVADFAVSYAGDAAGIPIYSWVYPEDREKGFYDYSLATRILPWFVKTVGPYPYRKLANIQSKTMFGGMENAGAIFYSENSVKGDRKVESLLTHEIAHQWFGDYATEASWQHVWLSEGFATYMTHWYMENTYGIDSLRQRLRDDRKVVIGFAAKSNAAVVDTTVNDNFMQLLNANSYQKGGWFLHMLRRKLGDAIFSKGLRAYYARFGGGNATTGDFRSVMETAYGQSLQAFFRQWLYMPGLPVLDASWHYDAQKKIITIQVEQQQANLFSFPITIGVNGGGKNSMKSFSMAARKSVFTMTLPAKPEMVVLDPEVNLLFKGTIREAE